MNERDVVKLLRTAGVPKSRISVSNKLVNLPCLFAYWFHDGGVDEHPSAIISHGKGPSWYYCYSCGERGALWEIFNARAALEGARIPREKWLKLEDRAYTMEAPIDSGDLLGSLDCIGDQLEEWRLEVPKVGGVWRIPEYLYKWMPPVDEDEEAVKYLESRNGVTLDLARKYDLRFDHRQFRVVYLVKQKGEVVGAVGRLTHNADGELPYYNYWRFPKAEVLGGMEFATGKTKAIVCEGFFDMIAVSEVAPPEYAAVCTFGARCSESQARILARNFVSLTFFYDNDRAGERGWVNAKRTLEKQVAAMRRVTPEVGLDAASMPREQRRSLIERSQELLHV